jgi:hypothetical protein
LKDWKFAAYGKCTSQSASTGGEIFTDHFEEAALIGRVNVLIDKQMSLLINKCPY